MSDERRARFKISPEFSELARIVSRNAAAARQLPREWGIFEDRIEAWSFYNAGFTIEQAARAYAR